MEIDGPAREGDAYGVADLDVSAISDEAQVKAGAAFDASVKKGSPLKDAVQSGLSTGGAVAAGAACTAYGGAAVAPLCSAVGGWLGDKVGKLVNAIGDWFSDLFGPSEAYKKLVHDIRINEQDIKQDPNHVGTLYSQLGVVDYLLAKQLSDVVAIIGRAVQDFDMVADADHILDVLSKEGLKLVFIGDVHTASQGWTWVGPVPFQEDKYPEFKWDGKWGAPSYQSVATAILQQWGSGAITNKAAADAVNGIISQSKDWSDALATAATKYLTLVATDITVREGLTTAAGRYAPHVSEPDPVRVAAMRRNMSQPLVASRTFRDSYLPRFGIIDSIQFLRP